MFTVTSSVSNGIGGTISPAVSSVLFGGSTTLTVAPSIGYHLSALIDNGVNVTAGVIGNSYTITNITTDHAVIATFAGNTFAISAGVNDGGNGGSITPVSANAGYGTNVTFTIIPNGGYIFIGLTDNGATVTATENPPGTFTYTISNVTADHNVQAIFSRITAASVSAIGPWGFLAAAAGLLGLALKHR